MFLVNSKYVILYDKQQLSDVLITVSGFPRYSFWRQRRLVCILRRWKRGVQLSSELGEGGCLDRCLSVGQYRWRVCHTIIAVSIYHTSHYLIIYGDVDNFYWIHQRNKIELAFFSSSLIFFCLGQNKVACQKLASKIAWKSLKRFFGIGVVVWSRIGGWSNQLEVCWVSLSVGIFVKKHKISSHFTAESDDKTM